MIREFRSPTGALLFTQAELDQALAAHRARRLLPAWMHALRWPRGMLAALRLARREGDRRALYRLLGEARMLAQAEAMGYGAAAAAIRHRLRARYPAPPGDALTSAPARPNLRSLRTPLASGPLPQTEFMDPGSRPELSPALSPTHIQVDRPA